ncbi:MAG: response regulator [Lachnospiraceae bacterium]|nr:response regulator [Lachnospiraceae bacterium]
MADVEKKIILVGDEKRFMVNSVIKGLEKEGFIVNVISPSVRELNEVSDDINVYVLFLGETEANEALTFLNDKISEKGILVYALGTSEELKKLYTHINEQKFEKTFERPFNVKDIASSLELGIYTSIEQTEKKKILVIDDDGVMLRTIKEWLKDKYNVFMVNQGVDAITFLAKNEVDLVLLDYEMPVTDGPTVLGMIRAQKHLSNLPVMFLTSKDDKDSVMKIVHLKPEKYLLKSSKPEELVASIDDFFLKQKIDRYNM